MVPYLNRACLYTIGTPATLAIGPPLRDLGDVPANEAAIFPAAFTVDNPDPGQVTIHRLWFEDAQGREDTSGDWTVLGLGPVATPPFLMPPTSSFAIDVAVRLSQVGVQATRYLAVEASSPGLAPWRIRAAVQATAAAPILAVLPPSLLEFFASGTVRSVQVENAGSASLNRTSLVLEGDHPEYFEIVSASCGQSPWGPPGSVCSLSSAQTELVRIRYQALPAPWANLMPPHTARLRIVTDVGETSITLQGTYPVQGLSR
jgi:hypothetical protein